MKDKWYNPPYFGKNINKKYGGVAMYKGKSYYRGKAKRIIKYINLISNKFKDEKTEKQQVLENLNRAHNEWKMKEKYFEHVTDPDLVDHAIYELKASKIKYMYLLKKAKKMDNE